MSTPATERAREQGDEPDPPPPPASARPLPPPAGSGAPFAPTPPWAGAARPVRPLPAWSPGLIAAVVAVAVLADLALRVPVASAATTLLVGATAALLVIAGRAESMAQRCGVVLLLGSGLVLAIRDSPWVTAVIALSVAVLVALLAGDGLVLGQRRPWARTIGAGLDALVDLVPWLRDGGAQIGRRASGRLGVGLRAAGIGVVVAFVLGGLLASGDAAFGWLVSIFDVATWVGHAVVVAMVIPPAALLALVAARAAPVSLETGSTETGSTETGSPGAGPGTASNRSFRVEALAALWATAGTLLVWCAMQVVLISGGARAVVLAEQGLTAAEYARQGFFQLAAVAALSLAVLNLGHRAGRRGLTPDPAQRLPAVLIGLTLGALIVVSFSRLGYYIGSFGLTMLRLSVATFLAWLGVMTAASVARSLGLHHERNWLPTGAVFSAAIFAIAFGLANPERWVAQVNLDRATVTDPVDEVYLVGELSSDAWPTLANYRWSRLGGRPDLVTAELCRAAAGGDGSSLLGWNRSRSFRPDLDCADPAPQVGTDTGRSVDQELNRGGE